MPAVPSASFSTRRWSSGTNMSSNTSSPLFMNRHPMVSLQRATRQPGRLARHEKRGRALQHADLGIGVGIDDVEPGIVAIGDELLAAVDHPAAVAFDGARLHGRFRHVVGQPAIGRAARLGEAMGEQELRIVDEALEPLLLQLARREVTQQDRHFPVLHQLVGKTGIAARDLLRDDREDAHFAAFYRARRRRALPARPAFGCRSGPRLPGFAAAAASSGVIRHSRCQSLRMNGMTTSSTKWRQLCRISRCSSDKPRCGVISSMMQLPGRP